MAQVNNALGWSQVISSPDYFNSCVLAPSNIGVPNNIFGYQQPATGNAYIGLTTFYDDGLGSLNTREFAGAELTSPLISGQKYYVSMKVNLSLSTSGTTNTAINKIGAWFTTAPSMSYTHNLAQVYSNNIITDSSGWYSINGSFIADSNYTFIMLGNFFSDVNTDTIIYPITGPDKLSYYFIDDVCVSTDSLECFNTVGIKEFNYNKEKKIIRIVDVLGRETEDKSNILLIFIYSDGTTEKVFRLE